MRTRTKVSVFGLLLLYTVAPILCVLISSGVASATGSRLDEAGTHPCIVFGIDIGGLLYAMFVAGWFGLVTIPTGLLAMVAFGIFLLFRRVRAP